MKIKIIFILIISQVIVSTGQKTFNKAFELKGGISAIELLYETAQYDYSIGYAQNSAEIGVQVLCHDKNTGEVCRQAYFEIEGWWLFIAGQPPVYQIGDQLIFGMVGRNVLFKLAYNIPANSISMQDSIHNRLPGGYYFNDMILSGDTTIYNATITQETTNINTIIYSFPGGRKKFIYMPNKTGYNNTAGRVVQKDNGNLIVFASRGSLTVSGDEFITVTEIDTSGNIIREYTSPQNHRVWLTDDILLKNNNEVFILARGDLYDAILKKRASSHWLYKFDLSTYQVIWRKNYGEPASNYFSGGGEICKGHRDAEYLYCTTLWGKGASLDSLYLVGRVVKVREDGSKIWQKDYSYLPNLDTNSDLYTMISVDSSHYLLGGRTSTDTTICSWLVKIDEDGNIVPVDTTSTIPITDIPDITIYPNPATDQIIINQGETSDMVYTIYDAQGRMAMRQSVTEPHQNMIWDISPLSSGMYVLAITRQGKIIKSVPLVVQ